VAVAQHARRMRCDDAALGECRERRQRAAQAQRRLPAAANDLQRLYDELDLANAAAAELDVVVLARFLVADLPMHAAQSLVRVVVEVLAVDKGCDQRPELVVALAGERSRLEPRVALPGDRKSTRLNSSH